MTSQQALQQTNLSVENATIGGIPCAVGYEKKFKWAWFATQLNTFVIIGETNEPITKAVIEKFSTDCFEYALKNNKGWPRGLQAGVGAIAILKGSTVDSEAVAFCEKLDKKHWSAFEVPVIYNTQSGVIHKYVKSPIWGTIYFPHFTDLINSVASKLKS